MSSFSDLPAELTTDILVAAIPQHPNPSCILAVNRCFNDIGQFIIYTSLRFKSESQLVRFALKRRFHVHHHTSRTHNTCHTPNNHHDHHDSHNRHKNHGHQEDNCVSAVVASAKFSGGAAADPHSGTLNTVVGKLLPHSPRSISIQIPGGQGGGIVFEGIKHVFELCAKAVGTSVLVLDSLEFCLHSHTSDPAPWKIGEALSLVKYVSPRSCEARKLTLPRKSPSPVHVNSCGQDQIPRTTFLQRFVFLLPLRPYVSDLGC